MLLETESELMKDKFDIIKMDINSEEKFSEQISTRDINIKFQNIVYQARNLISLDRCKSANLDWYLI